MANCFPLTDKQIRNSFLCQTLLQRINFNFAITRFQHLCSNEPATSTLAHAFGFDIVLTCGKPLHDLIIKLIGIASAHVTRLTPPHFFETPEQSQDSKNSYVYRYICCQGIDFTFFYFFFIRFQICSDIVVFFSHFIRYIEFPTVSTIHDFDIGQVPITWQYYCLKLPHRAGHPLCHIVSLFLCQKLVVVQFSNI